MPQFWVYQEQTVSGGQWIPVLDPASGEEYFMNPTTGQCIDRMPVVSAAVTEQIHEQLDSSLDAIEHNDFEENGAQRIRDPHVPDDVM